MSSDRSRPSRAPSWGSAALAASAALLGATALYVKTAADRAERDNPPIGQFMGVEGVKLHYLDTGGERPAIVLLHGNGAMIADMIASGLVERLAGRHRVVVFDRPGYGYSERPRGRSWDAAAQAHLFLRAFDRLGLARPILVGHSWGTLVATEAALAAPGRFAGLALLSGYYFPTARGDVALLSPYAVPLAGDVLRYTIAPLIGRASAPRAIDRMFAPLPVPERFRRMYPLELALRPSQIRASSEEAAAMAAAAQALASRYRELRLPVSILAGADDQIVTSERQSVRLHHEIPGSRLLLLPGLGHMIHHQATEAVAEAIEALGPPAR